MAFAIVDDMPLLSQWIKKLSFRRTRVFWRYRPDLNWGMRVLQTLALPLGHGTIFNYEIRNAGAFLISLLERVTRLELATSTLARWRSTG